MTFSSALFVLFFLPAVLLVYYIIPGRFFGARNAVLLLSSAIFYAWGEPVNILFILISAAVNYSLAILPEKYGKGIQGRRLWFAAALIFNIGLLVYLKYGIFFTGNAAQSTAFPIGMSFFTLQAISYVYDVYSGIIPAQKSIPEFALYLSFFPKMAAGPVVRFKEFKAQLSERKSTADGFLKGAACFTRGFAKKVLLASITAVTADAIFEGDIGTSAAAVWIGTAVFGLEIFFGLSGYTDMAAGLARMFGFDFPESFDYPYISVSLRDFWRRWHISVSSWFRDYLYIPLGGSRSGCVRTSFNLLIVFAAAGLWYGTGLNFLLWGLYHGLFFILERTIPVRIKNRIPRFIGRIYTLIIILAGWTIFRADTPASAIHYLITMFNPANLASPPDIPISGFTLTVLFASVILSVPAIPYLKEKLLMLKYGRAVSDVLVLFEITGLLLLSIAFLTDSELGHHAASLLYFP